MKGCIDCIHHKSTLSADLKSCSHKCLKGRQKDCDSWWERNGKINREDYNEEMPCHEAHPLITKLDAVLEKGKQLLDILNRLPTSP